MTDCKYWNESWGPSFAGRCSAPDDVKTNSVNKWCKTPQTCPYLLKNRMNNQEILNGLNEKIKAAEEALRYLKLAKGDFERVIAMSKKSPVEEAYKDWWGEYPTKTWQVDVDRWNAFQAGYNAAYEEKVTEKDMVKENLKTSLQEMINGDVRPIDDVVKEAREEQIKKLQEKEWTYKVTDEKGETNPYKNYMNSVRNLEENNWYVDAKSLVKPPTLWERFYAAKWSDSACDEFCEIVEQWLNDNTSTVEEDYHTVTLKLKKGMLGKTND